jgi:hypothetical protein
MILHPAIVRPRSLGAALLALLLLVLLLAGSPRAAAAAEATVPLGSAASYAVLAGSTVTNTGPSVLDGDLGLHPGSAVQGFPPGRSPEPPGSTTRRLSRHSVI